MTNKKWNYYQEQIDKVLKDLKDNAHIEGISVKFRSEHAETNWLSISTKQVQSIRKTYKG